MSEPTTTDASAVTPRKRRRRNECNAAQYDDDVLELIQAVDFYRRRYNRSFPPWSEVLSILKALGFQKVGERAGSSLEDCVVAAMNRQVVEPMDAVDTAAEDEDD